MPGKQRLDVITGWGMFVLQVQESPVDPAPALCETHPTVFSPPLWFLNVYTDWGLRDGLVWVL